MSLLLLLWLGWGILLGRILAFVYTSGAKVLQRFGDNYIFPCEMTNKCRGALRRRRVRAKGAQKHVRILARETPRAVRSFLLYWDLACSWACLDEDLMVEGWSPQKGKRIWKGGHRQSSGSREETQESPNIQANSPAKSDPRDLCL